MKKNKLLSEYLPIVLYIGFLGLIISGVMYVVLYAEMHGEYTKIFTSDEVIQQERKEREKQIESEILDKSTLENSYAWQYLYDYNDYVQRNAIEKLKLFKEIDKVKNKFIEIGTDSYQKEYIRSRVLCAIQDDIVYSGIIEDNMANQIFEYCLTEKNIKKSYSIREKIIDIYENHRKGYGSSHNIKIALKYEEAIRDEYADYLKNRTFFKRFFNIKGFIDYFTNEDLIIVIKALSNRELILGDKNVQEALIEVLKVEDSKVISYAGEALRTAYRSHLEAQNILASHLKSDNKDIRHTAIYELEIFYETNAQYTLSIVSNIIPMLDDRSSNNRESAIKILKPLLKDYSNIKENKYDKEAQLIVEAYNKINYLSKNDLDEDVRNKARKAID